MSNIKQTLKFFSPLSITAYHSHEYGGCGIEQVLGNVVFKIPHSDELENQALAGDLFRDLVLKDSRRCASIRRSSAWRK